jgi:hypothetical protein
LVGNTNEQTINRCGSNHAPSLSEQSTWTYSGLQSRLDSW